MEIESSSTDHGMTADIITDTTIDRMAVETDVHIYTMTTVITIVSPTADGTTSIMQVLSRGRETGMQVL